MFDCQRCFKFYHRVVPEGCIFCQNYQFQENILCELSRADQGGNEVECASFRPNLSVLGETDKPYEIVKETDKKFNLPDRQKWLKAYMLQQCKLDPDQIFSDLRFHLCLFLKNREQWFSRVAEKLDKLASIFSDSADQFAGKVSLLCAGTDHVHLYIELPVDCAPDDAVNKIAEFSESAIRSEFSGAFDENCDVFAKAYFIESVVS